VWLDDDNGGGGGGDGSKVETAAGPPFRFFLALFFPLHDYPHIAFGLILPSVNRAFFSWRDSLD